MHASPPVNPGVRPEGALDMDVLRKNKRKRALPPGQTLPGERKGARLSMFGVILEMVSLLSILMPSFDTQGQRFKDHLLKKKGLRGIVLGEEAKELHFYHFLVYSQQ